MGSALVLVRRSSRSPRSTLTAVIPVAGQVARPGSVIEQPAATDRAVVGLDSTTVTNPTSGVIVTRLASPGAAT